jgi:16S rRNA (uracil1498-N3)-methyltransferase
VNLFYHPQPLHETNEIFLDKDESRHVSKVLRKQPGDLLHITDGAGCIYTARLVNTNAKRCVARIVEKEEKAPMPYQLHMAVAPTKTNDRFEWFLEKATEIGISEITPILCEHSERRNFKPERYEKIVQSAMKQSLKAHLPTLNPAIRFDEFLRKAHDESIRCIAHCEESHKKSLKETVFAGTSVLILIGPEGDFSPSEIELATQLGFVAVALGASRLRTETAAIVACHSVAFINQD